MAKKQTPAAQPWESDTKPVVDNGAAPEEAKVEGEEVTVTVTTEDAEILGIEPGEHKALKTVDEDGADLYSILDAEGEVVGTLGGNVDDENEPEPETKKETPPAPPVETPKAPEPVVSAAITKTPKKAETDKLGAGDQLPLEVLNMISMGKSLSEALKIYNSKQK